MQKKYLVLVLLFLTGCDNKSQVACEFNKDDASINLLINANNDLIDSIDVRIAYEIPYAVILNDKFLNDLNAQLDDHYHYEDNILVKEYSIDINKDYSLALTLDYLRSKRYFCD